MPRAAGLVLVALVAALIIPTSVMAAKADRYTDTSTQLWCGELQSDAGTAYASAWLSDRGETFADLGFWAAPATRETSPITWAGWSNETLMSDDGSTLEITFGVYGSNEGDVDDPSDLVFIGDGTLTATAHSHGRRGDIRRQRSVRQSPLPLKQLVPGLCGHGQPRSPHRHLVRPCRLRGVPHDRRVVQQQPGQVGLALERAPRLLRLVNRGRIRRSRRLRNGARDEGRPVGRDRRQLPLRLRGRRA